MKSSCPKILVVEDSKDVSQFLERGLVEEGFEVHLAPTGNLALRKIEDGWDLIVLDLMLPDISGETILKFLAQQSIRPPVLVLTAKISLEDKVSLFRVGCDDYLTKPFAFEELLARIQALLRRSQRVLPEVCTYEDMSLDPSTHELRTANHSINLTPKEFAICRLLMSEPGRMVSRKEISQSIWGSRAEPVTNFVEVHLANLRKKLSYIERGQWLQTLRNNGITLRKPDSSPSYGS